MTPARVIAAMGVLALAAFGLAQLATPLGLEQARRTWRSLEPDERRELVRRYEELERLPRTERRELFRRVEKLREVEGELIDELPEDARQKLSRFDERDQRRIVREMLRSELAARGRLMRDELPRDLLERLEGVPPERRIEILASYERELRAQTLERLAGALGLDQDEVRQLNGMTDDEVHAEMLALRRQVIERQIDLRGLPRWVPLDVWRAMQSADDATFNRMWNRELTRHRRAGERNPPASDPGGRMRLAQRIERVRTALRPDPAWHVELAELPREERRQAFEERVAKRVQVALEGLPIDEARRTELAGLRGVELADAVRTLMRELAREGGPSGRPLRR